MKKIILTSESVMKNADKLLESANSYKLPKFLYKRIKTRNTSLGDNEAFPTLDFKPFDYTIIKKRYEEVTENLRKVYGGNFDTDTLTSELSKLMKRCIEIEKPFRSKLEKLCENIIFSIFEVPSETVNFKCELVDKIVPQRGQNIMPEDDEDNRNFDFEDLEDYGNASKIILKRRMINSLIQGASYEYTFTFEDFADDLNEINPDLCSLYETIITINDYLLFTKQENITDEHNMQGAYVEVMLGRDEEKTEITTQGLILPYLINDSIRGFMELFASHGLPKDVNKAKYVIGKADFLLAEPWDLRFGVGLWKYFGDIIDDTRLLPYFFSLLCSMEINDFNESLREIFASTKKGQNILADLYEKSNYYYEKQDFISTMQQKNIDASMLNDNYISADELDDYVLQENGIEEINDVYNTNKNSDENCPLLDKVYGDGFILRQMLEYDDPYDRIEYAEEYLECLGEGKRRTVFLLNDNLILKLTNGNHRFQTKNEYDSAMYLGIDLFPRIIYQSYDFSWTISERARELTNNDCIRILGMPLYSNDEDEPSFEDFQIWAETSARQRNRQSSNKVEMHDNTLFANYYATLVRKNQWFKEYYKLELSQRGDLDFGTDINPSGYDFRGENLGVVNRNGKDMVVLVDGGFTKPWDTRKLNRKYGEYSPQIKGEF